MELLDVLDQDGNKTGVTKPRKEIHQTGEYHLVVHAWIINDKNEVLIQKRSMNKETNPGKWDTSYAGHAEAGQSSKEAAIREAKEELGIDIKDTDLELVGTFKRDNQRHNNLFIRDFEDMYVIHKNINLLDIQLQAEEVDDIRLMPLEELKKEFETYPERFIPHKDYDVLFTRFLLGG